jgi:hypothetical protein
MTPLMTVIVSGERTVAETTTPDFLGRVDTVFGVQLDDELLRNLIVSVEPEFARQDFPNTPRRDDVVRMGVGVDYLVNIAHRRLGSAMPVLNGQPYPHKPQSQPTQPDQPQRGLADFQG